MSIPGIEVQVKLFGKPVTMTSAGYIGLCTGTGHGMLTVKVLPGHSFVGFDRAEGSGAVTQLNNHGTVEAPVYQRTVPVFRVRGEEFSAPDPKSAIWLLGVDAEGKAHIVIVSLVSQNGHWFLTYCEIFREQCYRREDGIVVCPGLEKDWGPMAAEVGNLLGQVEITLPAVEDYRPPQSISAKDLPPGHARVKWFTIRLGVGIAVVVRDGEEVEARIHYSQVNFDRKDGLKYFMPGEVVQFVNIIPRTAGHHKPTPQWELRGLTLA